MAGGSGKLLKDGPAFEAGSGDAAGAEEVMWLMRDCPLAPPRLAEPVEVDFSLPQGATYRN